MTASMTIECEVHFNRPRKGRKELLVGPVPTVTPGRVPRVARFMALALRLQRLVRSGVVRDYAELARLGHVSRARVSQVMNLLQLAPDIQEQLLFLPRTERGRDPIILRELQPIACALEWQRQRRMWAALLSE